MQNNIYHSLCPPNLSPLPFFSRCYCELMLAKENCYPNLCCFNVITKKRCPHAQSFCSSTQRDQREQSYVKANLMHQNKHTYEKMCSSYQKIQPYTTLGIRTVRTHSTLVILVAHCTYFANCSCPPATNKIQLRLSTLDTPASILLYMP